MNINNNNRKYLTSTGMLLKTLAADDKMLNNNNNANNQFNNSFNLQQQQQPPLLPQPPFISQAQGLTLPISNAGSMVAMNNNFVQQKNIYPNHFYNLQQQNNTNNNNNNYFNNSRGNQQMLTNYNTNDNMMNQNSSAQQQRWQQQQKSSGNTFKQQSQSKTASSSNFPSQKTTKKTSSHSNANITNQPSNISTTTELPETFGLPSNTLKNNASNNFSYKSTGSSSTSSLATSNKSSANPDILIDDIALINSTTSQSAIAEGVKNKELLDPYRGVDVQTILKDMNIEEEFNSYQMSDLNAKIEFFSTNKKERKLPSQFLSLIKERQKARRESKRDESKKKVYNELTNKVRYSMIEFNKRWDDFLETLGASKNSSISPTSKRDEKQQVSDSAVSSTADIEIISENFPISTNHQNVTNTNTNLTIQTAANNDELFKNYLTRIYNSNSTLNGQLKPQSNFISNFSFINHALNSCGYYDSKLKRSKPYSANIKSKDINSLFNDDSGEDEANSDNSDTEDISRKRKIKENNVKNTKIIVIDDTNDEMHKPWITPELINLIKHRNLLQAKINEKNLLASKEVNEIVTMETDEAKEATTDNSAVVMDPADAELLKKFKNLRNKVTKLVKKARKEYVAKYIKENKQTIDLQKANFSMSSNEAPKTAQASGSTLIDSSNKLQISNSMESKEQHDEPKSSPKAETNSVNSIKTGNKDVNNIVTQLTSSNKNAENNQNSGSFLKDQKSLIMNLYNSFYNQYIQTYSEQQKKAQDIQSKGNNETSDPSSYEELQKQAAYYAQQQLAVQSQLEKSLQQSAQQLIQEIAEMASKNTHSYMFSNPFPPPPQTQLHHHLTPHATHPHHPSQIYQPIQMMNTSLVGHMQPTSSIVSGPPSQPSVMPIMMPQVQQQQQTASQINNNLYYQK